MMDALWAQLFGVGVIWVTVHCAGMCGPVIGGLIGHAEARGAPAEGALGRRARGALAYQAGRAVTYALLGASAGALGAGLEASLARVSAAASLVMGVGALAMGIRQIVGGSASNALAQSTGRALGGALRRAARLAPRRGPARMFALGILMGLLPCMLMFWALGLAVASASWLQGAAMMVALVGMTTPVIVGASCSTALLGRVARRAGAHAAPWALALSGLWMLAIGAAANDLIPHAHWAVSLGGRSYTLMLF